MKPLVHYLLTIVHTGHRRSDPAVMRIAVSFDKNKYPDHEARAQLWGEQVDFWFDRVAMYPPEARDVMLLVEVSRIDNVVVEED